MPKPELDNDYKTHPTMHSNLLIDEPPLQVLPALAVAIGLNEAIVLQQLHYWVRRSSNFLDGLIWVYNSYEEWQEQFPFWSLRTIRRTFTSLEEQGVIMARQPNRRNWDQRKWYAILYEELDRKGVELAKPRPRSVPAAS
jgi:hypothetical protein